jgi:hypothetical protein
MMFSGYPRSDFTDPAAAALSMCAVFEDYSDAIIKYSTDPKTGVQRKYKWPPKIAEVVEFCDAQVEHIAKMERYKTWGKGDGGALMIEGPREEKPTLEEMHAKYGGKHWGIDQGDTRTGTLSKPAPTWDKVVAHMQADPSILARLTAPLMTRSGSEMTSDGVDATVAAPPGASNLPVSKSNSDEDSVEISTAWPTARAA